MLNFLLYLILGYLILLVVFYFVQRHLIYFPGKYASSPAEAGVPEMRVIELHTGDGLTLNAWYRPSLQHHLPTIVHFHGNAGHIGNRGMIVKPYLNEGFGVLLLTYRGYSGNPGSPSEEGLYQDARAAMEFLKREGVPEQSIVLYGDSIGAAVAVQMAIEWHVGAIVLQAPFTSLADVGHFHYPFFPVRLFLKDKFDILNKVHKIHVPVFIIHGKSDNIIPPVFGRQLFEAFSEPKQIELIPHTGHNNLYEPAIIIRFIKEWICLA